MRALAEALGLDEDEQVELRAVVPRRQPAGTADEPPAAVPAPTPPGPSTLRPAPLPVPPTPLLGRGDEAAALSATVRDAQVRLVTLTGVGGVAKSRLAIEVAGRAAPSPSAPRRSPAGSRRIGVGRIRTPTIRDTVEDDRGHVLVESDGTGTAPG